MNVPILCDRQCEFYLKKAVVFYLTVKIQFVLSGKTHLVVIESMVS